MELDAALRRHPGSLPVYLDVWGQGRGVSRIMLGNHCRVRAGEPLLGDVAGLLGKGRVQFLFRQGNGGSRDRRS